jgi:ferredoxin-type protein NapH
MTTEGPSWVLLVISSVVLLVSWPSAAILLFRANATGLAISLFGLGLSLGPCLAGYALARKALKQRWRQLILATGGLAILAFSLVDAINLDLDGFFALVILGTMGAAVGHTMATTLIGPMVFGRLLCGWGCWRAMVLELLPTGRGSARRTGVWALTPFVGMAASVGAAVQYDTALHVRPGGIPGHMRGDSVWPVAAGVGVYYLAAIGLALALRDQRAFCKYLCPTGLVLRLTSRRALLHVVANAELCTECGACSVECPMDIPVAARVSAGTRIGSGNCILCQRCVTSCPSGALATAFGFGRRATRERRRIER